MEKSFEIAYHKIEKSNWWSKARRDIIFKLMQIYANKNSKILEVGCTAGTLIKFLNQKGYDNVYGIDRSKNSISLCKNNGIKNVFVMDASKTKFKNKEFDLIIASDVLEHIKNDISALKEWHRILKPNGKLLIFVPAFNFLWSEHDEKNKHYRRYSKKELINKLETSNFKVKRSSYWNFVLFFPASLIRIFKKTQSLNQVYSQITNKLIFTLLKIENWFLKRINLPVGVSIFAIAEK